MFITTDVTKARQRINSAKQQGKKVGFVPTMGALHAGHLSLVRAARRQCGFVVVSIFVNPLQFGPQEDLNKYPRQFKQDKSLLQKEKVDLLFYPSVKTIYAKNFSVFVEEKQLSNFLCGISRPGHFQGVCTIVAKLFNIISLDIAYFGQKDYQQAQIIRRMARDLNFPVEVKVLPIIREKDGLALSSRNKYLNPLERNDALVIYRALKLAEKNIKSGQRNPAKIIAAMQELILSAKSAKIDYLEIVDPKDFSQVREIKGKILIALAVWIGRTRLIDNIILNVK